MNVTDHGQRRDALGRRRAARPARALAARRPRPHRHPLGLRHVELRRLRRAPRRRAGEELHGARRDGRRPHASTPSRASSGADGLDPVQQGFMECHGLQCGFCTPGMMLTARWLLDRNPDPSEADDPRGDQRAALPLHRLPQHRQVGPLGRRARTPEEVDVMSATEKLPLSAGRQPDRLRAHAAQGGRPLPPRPGQLPRRHHSCPGMLHGAILRSPYAHARIVSIDTSAAEAHPKVKAVITGADARRAEAGLDADAVGRRAGRARHRQGALPGPGGRLRHRRGPLLGPRRARADRRRVRAAAADDRRPARRSTPTPRSSATTSRARPTTTSSTGSPATRPPTDAAFAAADVIVALDMLYPRSHPAPMETCGSVAYMDPVTGKLTAYITSQAPHAHRTVYALVAGHPRAQDPGDLARHRRRVRQQGADLPRLRARGRRLDRHQASR